MPLARAVLAIAFALCLRSVNCCPENTYPKNAQCVSCPPHTESLENSASAHDCRCMPGFMCMYYKQIRATVLINSTVTEFQTNANNVRSAFLAGMAAAAGVEPDRVTIRGVYGRSRRILGGSGRGVDVHVDVVGAVALRDVGLHLTGMHLRDSWEVVPCVTVLSIPKHASLEQNM